MVHGLGSTSSATITRHLRGIQFPATKDDLVEQALDNGADDITADLLGALPDRQYEDLVEVMDAYGEARRRIAMSDGAGEDDDPNEEDTLFLDDEYEEDDLEEADED